MGLKRLAIPVLVILVKKSENRNTVIIKRDYAKLGIKKNSVNLMSKFAKVY